MGTTTHTTASASDGASGARDMRAMTEDEVIAAATKKFLRGTDRPEALRGSPQRAKAELLKATNLALAAWCKAREQEPRGIRELYPRQAAELLLAYNRVVLIPTDDGENRDSAMLAVYDADEGCHVEAFGSSNRLTGWMREVFYTAKGSYLDECLRAIRDLAPLRRQCEDSDLVFFEDCVYHVSTGEREPHSPDRVVLSKVRTRMPLTEPPLPVITRADGTSWDPWSWLVETMGSEQGARTILELVNWAMRPRSFRDDKVVMLYAEDGSNGKGTVLEMLRCILGGSTGRRCVSIPLEAFGGATDSFMLTQLIGAVANLSDESNPDGFMASSGLLKAISSHDSIQVNRKHKDPVSVKLYVPMIFSVNRLPKIKDKTRAVDRRLFIVKFNKRFMDKGTEIAKDPAIKADYVKRDGVREWLVWQAMQLGAIDSLTETAEVSAALDSYRENNDSVVAFWAEFGEVFAGSGLDSLPLDMLHDAYVGWMRGTRKGSVPVEKRAFLDRLVPEATGSGLWRDERDGNDNRKKPRLTGWIGSDGAKFVIEHFGEFGKVRLVPRDGNSKSDFEEELTGYGQLARWTRMVNTPSGTIARAQSLPSRCPALTRVTATKYGFGEFYAAASAVAASDRAVEQAIADAEQQQAPATGSGRRPAHETDERVAAILDKWTRDLARAPEIEGGDAA